MIWNGTPNDEAKEVYSHGMSTCIFNFMYFTFMQHCGRRPHFFYEYVETSLGTLSVHIASTMCLSQPLHWFCLHPGTWLIKQDWHSPVYSVHLEYIGVHFCTSVHSYAVHFIVHLSTLWVQLRGWMDRPKAKTPIRCRAGVPQPTYAFLSYMSSLTNSL